MKEPYYEVVDSNQIEMKAVDSGNGAFLILMDLFRKKFQNKSAKKGQFDLKNAKWFQAQIWLNLSRRFYGSLTLISILLLLINYIFNGLAKFMKFEILHMIIRIIHFIGSPSFTVHTIKV